jgi:hypothetical protein
VIHPKPHRLIRGSFVTGKDLSIECCNTVIQPNIEEKLILPNGVNTTNFLNSTSDFIGVPTLSERWEQGMTYG